MLMDKRKSVAGYEGFRLKKRPAPNGPDMSDGFRDQYYKTNFAVLDEAAITVTRFGEFSPF